MAWKLAELFVSITGDDKPLNRTLDGVHQKLGLAGAAFTRSLMAGGGLAAAGLAAGLVAGLRGGVLGAVELEDTLNRTRVVFGDSARLIISQADEMAARFAVVREEFIGAAASFGAMFKGAGASQRDAAVLGNQLAQLGLDMRSFAGGTTTAEEAFTALAAAMRGEFDPIERFNVFLTADAVAAHAVASGLARSKTEVDNYAKKQAALALILEQTKDQQGDMAKTIGDTGPQMEMLRGNLTNLAATIGETLLPTVNSWVSSLNDRLGPAMEATGFWARRAGDAFSILQLLVGAAVENSINAVEAFMTNASLVAGYIAGNWRALITDGVAAVGTVFSNLADNFGDLAAAIWEFMQDPTGGFDFEWTPLLDGFKATAEKLPEMVRPGMVNVAGEIAQILAGGLIDETKRAADKARDAADLAGAKAGGGGRAAAGKEAKTEIVAADQFWKDLLGKDKTAKEQLDVQRDQLDVQREQHRAIVDLGKDLKKPRIAVAGP